MALKIENITFDSTDPERLADWWARALDGQVNPIAPPFFVDRHPAGGPGAGLPEGRRPDARQEQVHIDFAAADMEAEVKRLVELGASETGRGSSASSSGWCSPTRTATRSASAARPGCALGSCAKLDWRP